MGANSGDVVELEPEWVAINGRRLDRSRVASRDSAGRPLSHVGWGKHTVGPDELWLFGFNDLRSWDSRYFGPVSVSDVRGQLKPVLTW